MWTRALKSQCLLLRRISSFDVIFICHHYGLFGRLDNSIQINLIRKSESILSKWANRKRKEKKKDSKKSETSHDTTQSGKTLEKDGDTANKRSRSKDLQPKDQNDRLDSVQSPRAKNRKLTELTNDGQTEANAKPAINPKEGELSDIPEVRETVITPDPPEGRSSQSGVVLTKGEGKGVKTRSRGKLTEKELNTKLPEGKRKINKTKTTQVQNKIWLR